MIKQNNCCRQRQIGATLLESTVTLPIVLGIFAIATDSAQLLFKQSVFIDASNQALRDLELPAAEILPTQSCSDIIKLRVTEILPRYGVRTEDNPISISTIRQSGQTINVTLSLQSVSMFGGVNMTQYASVETNVACLGDLDTPPGDPNPGGV